MLNVHVGTLRIGVLFFVAFLSTSYISPDKTSDSKISLEDGSYELKTTGEYSLALKGEVDFKTSVEVSSKGKPFSTLKLNLRSHGEGTAHSLGFLISKQDTSRKITEGTYIISGKIDGFLNYFDGVFGFANIKTFGELPFFARNGKITIQDIGPNQLKGSILVSLENPDGKSIDIAGNFIALRKN